MKVIELRNETNEQAVLTRELAVAAYAYYNNTESGLSDIEYDRKYEHLQQLEQASGFAYEQSPTLHVGAPVVDALQSIKLEIPALSLDKFKYKDRLGLVKTFNAPEGEGVLMSWKMDGSTVVLTYDNGRLTQAVTRGDGITGSDITHNARYFRGVPTEIGFKGHLTVRGEAVMKLSEFDRINDLEGTNFMNARNLATATIHMLDSNESRKREIWFYAFKLVLPAALDSEDGDISCYDLTKESERFAFVESLGFNMVRHEKIAASDIPAKIEEWKEELPKNDFPTDGLVFSFENAAYAESLGNTDKHPRGSFAMKWTDETYPTKITSIEWSVGKTGIITPVAIFDKVHMGLGSDVTRASLHNLSIMKKLGVRKDSRAFVYMANMIIPQVAEVENDGTEDEFDVPSVCPVCGQPTRIEDRDGIRVLHCDNPDCDARRMNMLMNTFGKDGLFVKGLGESQIRDLLEAKLVNKHPASFYEMAKQYGENLPDPLKALSGWGDKSWQKIVDAIETSRTADLRRFLYSLNIPMLGHDLSNKLNTFFKGDVNSFIAFYEKYSDENRQSMWEELTSIEGLGNEKAVSILDWMKETKSGEESDAWFRKLYNELTFEKPAGAPSDASLSGMTFVITGDVHSYRNRDEFKASVEARGGKVSGSVSKKTAYLVINDLESTTGKAQKARELGIPMISEDDFIEKFGK